MLRFRPRKLLVNNFARSLLIAFRLAWPDLLTPWRSPLVRWRMETYGALDAEGRLLHAEQITAGDFFRFLRQRGRQLLRFLSWAAQL